MYCMLSFMIFFFKQKTAYEMRISDWSSDVCSSDLRESMAQVPRRSRRTPQAVSLSGQTRTAHRAGIYSTCVEAAPARSPTPPPKSLYRSEERRVGKECVSTCRSRG